MLIKQLKGITIATLLEVSNIKVLQSVNELYSIIEYPKAKFFCKKITVFPVAHNGRILQLADNTVAQCEALVLPVSNCTKTTTTTFSKRVVNQTCANGLHSGGTANYQT